MVDALSGWLGLVLFAAAVAVALVLEALDALAPTDPPGGRHSRRPAHRWARPVLQAALGVLVAAALVATVARFDVFLH